MLKHFKYFAASLALVSAISALGGCATSSPASEQVTAEAPAPAYMIVLGAVYDREAFFEGYSAKLAPLYDKYGGEYVALGGGPMIEVLEGDYAPPSFVIGKWTSMQAARAFWNSPEYDVLRRARIDNNWGDFDVLLVQGLAEQAER